MISFIFRFLFIYLTYARATVAVHPWTKLTPTGTKPGALWGHSSIRYNKKMVMFGGQNLDTLFNDVWTLDTVSYAWQKNTTIGPSARAGHSSILHLKEMVMFGGFDGNKIDVDGNKNDVWALHLTSYAWNQRTTTGTKPSTRRGHSSIVYNGKMVMFGGGNAHGTYYDDTWALQLPFCWPDKTRKPGDCLYDFVQNGPNLDSAKANIVDLTITMQECKDIQAKNDPSATFNVRDVGPLGCVKLAANTNYYYRPHDPRGTTGCVIQGVCTDYRRTTPETCTGNFHVNSGLPGSYSALSKSECETVGGGKTHVDHREDQPSGCSMFYDYLYYFNTNSDSTVECTSSNYTCIQKRKWKSDTAFTQIILTHNPTHVCIKKSGNTIISTYAWNETTGITKPSARWFHTSILYNRQMVMFGGYNYDGAKDDAWALNLNSYTWNKLTTTGTKPSARFTHSSILYNGAMVMFGGNGDFRYTNDAWALDLTSYAWKQLETTSTKPTVRNGHSSILFENGLMVMFGGYGDTSYKNDAWALELNKDVMEIEDASTRATFSFVPTLLLCVIAIFV
jgi:N-acetylneuraminic acid mutarotase